MAVCVARQDSAAVTGPFAPPDVSNPPFRLYPPSWRTGTLKAEAARDKRDGACDFYFRKNGIGAQRWEVAEGRPLGNTVLIKGTTRLRPPRPVREHTGMTKEHTCSIKQIPDAPSGRFQIKGKHAAAYIQMVLVQVFLKAA